MENLLGLPLSYDQSDVSCFNTTAGPSRFVENTARRRPRNTEIAGFRMKEPPQVPCSPKITESAALSATKAVAGNVWPRLPSMLTARPLWRYGRSPAFLGLAWIDAKTAWEVADSQDKKAALDEDNID